MIKQILPVAAIAATLLSGCVVIPIPLPSATGTSQPSSTDGSDIGTDEKGEPTTSPAFTRAPSHAPVQWLKWPRDTIPSDCTEVNRRSAILQGVLRDTLLQCAADIRATNPACARIEKQSQLNGYYARASDRCVEAGKVGGLPDMAENAAMREEVAALSARIKRELPE